MNREKISGILLDRGVDAEHLKKLMDLMDVCELARFSPARNPDAMNQAYNASVEIISYLEKFKTV
jgi:hypothetical protein